MIFFIICSDVHFFSAYLGLMPRLKTKRNSKLTLQPYSDQILKKKKFRWDPMMQISESWKFYIRCIGVISNSGVSLNIRFVGYLVSKHYRISSYISKLMFNYNRQWSKYLENGNTAGCSCTRIFYTTSTAVVEIHTDALNVE